jgi:hypothetical protein
VSAKFFPWAARIEGVNVGCLNINAVYFFKFVADLEGEESVSTP